MMSVKQILNGLIISIALASCKGDDGPAGPQGPAGSNGAANVSSTDYTAAPSSWTNGASGWYINVSVPALTDATKDVVSVYVQLTSGGAWWALPTYNLYYTNDVAGFSFVNGTVTLSYKFTLSPPNTWYYRIVVVPAAIAIESRDVNFNNYDEVKTTFNLPD